jgi:hypothetical protein
MWGWNRKLLVCVHRDTEVGSLESEKDLRSAVLVLPLVQGDRLLEARSNFELPSKPGHENVTGFQPRKRRCHEVPW